MIKNFLLAIVCVVTAFVLVGQAQVFQAKVPHFGRRAADPTCTQKGQTYYNTATDAYKVCTVTGSPGTWVNLGGGSGLTMGTSTSDGAANTLLKTDGSGKVNNATGVTNPVSGKLLFNPGASDWAIDVDRTSNAGAVQGVRIVSGDNSNLAANIGLAIYNSAEDRSWLASYENNTDGFAMVAGGSYWRMATGGGVGGREIRLQPGGADRFITPIKKDLTNNTVTSLYEVALPTLTGTGGVIKGTTFVSNGTDVQSRSFVWRYSAVNKGGAYTTEIVVVSEAVSASSGTLTGTCTVVTGTNKITLKFNSNSSLGSISTQWIHFTIESFSDQVITLL